MTEPTNSEEAFKGLVLNSSSSAPPTSMRHVQASDPLRLLVLRPAGKVGGTAVVRAHIEPSLCASFYSPQPEERSSVLFGGERVPSGCLPWLSSHGVWYRPPRHMNFKQHFENYTVVALLRDPRARALSTYNYCVGTDRPGFVTSAARRMFSFKHFLKDPAFMARYGIGRRQKCARA